MLRAQYRGMTKPDPRELSVNAVDEAIMWLGLALKDILAGVPKLRGETQRVQDAAWRATSCVYMGHHGIRRSHYLRLADNAIARVRSTIDAFFHLGHVTKTDFEDVSRRCDRIEAGLAALARCPGPWDDVELPPLGDDDPGPCGPRRVRPNLRLLQ